MICCWNKAFSDVHYKEPLIALCFDESKRFLDKRVLTNGMKVFLIIDQLQVEKCNFQFPADVLI